MICTLHDIHVYDTSSLQVIAILARLHAVSDPRALHILARLHTFSVPHGKITRHASSSPMGLKHCPCAGQERGHRGAPSGVRLRSAVWLEALPSLPAWQDRGCWELCLPSKARAGLAGGAPDAGKCDAEVLTLVQQCREVLVFP